MLLSLLTPAGLRKVCQLTYCTRSWRLVRRNSKQSSNDRDISSVRIPLPLRSQSCTGLVEATASWHSGRVGEKVISLVPKLNYYEY